MVDDIICVTNVKRSAEVNSLINTFIESKKLKLSEKKCFQINCPKLKVRKVNMKEAEGEKYLGDMIGKSGSIQATIEHRKSKCEGIITGIMTILDDLESIELM